MGKHQLRMLLFAINHQKWFGYSTDRTTVSAIKSLEKLGLVETNKFTQFRLVQPNSLRVDAVK